MNISAMAGAILMLVTTAAAPKNDAPVEVMVLGTWHFANHNRDLHNVQSEDVRTPKRQAELAALADALARFKPTKIMVEKTAATAQLLDTDFVSFTPAMLTTERSERIQIGHRLAHRLGLKQVYAIDEQPGEGEPDYFPYGKVADYAVVHKQMAPIDQAQSSAAAAVKALNEKQSTMSIPAVLAYANMPDRSRIDIAPYYEMLKVGDAERQPGAELNAMWYMRNAKIFAKLHSVVVPGDRVLVVYGAGHSYWLRHFAQETPGYRNIDPTPYLQDAAAQAETATR